MLIFIELITQWNRENQDKIQLYKENQIRITQISRKLSKKNKDKKENNKGSILHLKELQRIFLILITKYQCFALVVGESISKNIGFADIVEQNVNLDEMLYDFYLFYLII